MERLVLDRFEEEFAVIEKTDENGEIFTFTVQRDRISPEVSEGTAITEKEGQYYALTEETEDVRRNILEILKRRRK